MAIPENGMLVRETGQPAVYVMCQGTLVWIPTPDALGHLGFGWGQVQVVPDGSLDGIPKATLPSMSATPPSMVFPISDPSKQTGHANKWVARTELPGLTLPNQNHVGTFKGVLLYVPAAGSGADIINTADPDITMIFLPHASCLDQPGIDPARLFKVGDILDSNENAQSNVHRAWVAKPRWKVEVCGFPAVNIQTAGDSPSNWVEEGNLYWPFWPPNLSGLVNQPVVMSGVLVADEPHTQSNGPDYRVAAIDWQGGPGDDVRYAANNPARYTEVHPPDSIVLDQRPNLVEDDLIGVAVSMGTTDVTPLPAQQELTVTLHPATNQPPGTKLQVEEIVLPDSYLPSLVEGNPTLTGAALQVNVSSFDLHVKVQAAPFNQHTGRFAAIYRMRWVPGGPPPECAQLDAQIANLRTQINNLQQELFHAPAGSRSQIMVQIADATAQVEPLQQQKAALGCP
jgi:hypothetical protein